VNDIEFGKYIKRLRKERKMTVRQLDLYSTVSHSYISQIERGERGIPSPAIIEKLSKALGVNYDEMMIMAGHMKDKTIPPNLTPYNPDEMIKLPILGTIRAGEPIYMNDNIEGYELVEPGIMRGRRGFLLRVKGDSMTGDRIYEGDRVLVLEIEEVNPSDIAVVAIDGLDATLKRVKCIDGQCVLSSSNPTYEPMFYSAKDVHILGKVIEVRHSIG
jgi:repressor LexA